MLLASFGLHLAVVLVFACGLLPKPKLDLRPVYYIDLNSTPVKSPQAGRPDARPPSAPKSEKPPAPAAPRPQPSKTEKKQAPKPEPVKPKTESKKVVAPEAKAVPKVETKPRPEPSAAADKALQERLRQLQARQEREELKQTLEGIAAKDTRQGGGADAPLGLPTGRGKEAGIDEQTWISAFIKQNWNLSPHQVSRRDLWAVTELVFDAKGVLIDYRIKRPSGEEIFDDSVRRAILKARQLPFAPERRLEIVVEFNLKDLEK